MDCRQFLDSKNLLTIVCITAFFVGCSTSANFQEQQEQQEQIEKIAQNRNLDETSIDKNWSFPESNIRENPIILSYRNDTSNIQILLDLDKDEFYLDLKDLVSSEKDTVIYEESLAQLKADIERLLAFEIANKLLSMSLDEDGLRIIILNSALYNSGKTQLLPKGEKIIDKITMAIKVLYFYNFRIDVEGHTDNVRISRSLSNYPSNWDLSIARSLGVVKSFIKNGIEEDRLKASGYADTKPLVPHVDKKGKDIIANRARNRRIEIRIYLPY